MNTPTNVSQIALSYVEPDDLIGFMIQHKLTSKIKYDAHNYSLHYLDANTLFCEATSYNTNLMITGLTIRNVSTDADLSKLKFPLQHLIHLIIKGEVLIHPTSNTLGSLNHFQCSNKITYLELHNLEIISLGTILSWKYLRQTKFVYCRLSRYDTNVLSNCTNLEYITIVPNQGSHSSSLPLSCPNLHCFAYISLENNTQITKIFTLTNCPKLQHIRIYQGIFAFYPLTELANLVTIQSLRYIDLSSCTNFFDITLLTKNTNIHRLNFSRTSITNISPLTKCKHLRHLNISHCTNITDISPLIKCKYLRHLNISHCTNITDISPLTKCKYLRYLNIIGCSNIFNEHVTPPRAKARGFFRSAGL